MPRKALARRVCTTPRLEKVAQAIWNAREDRLPPHARRVAWAHLHPDHEARQMTLAQAQAAIDTLEGARA